MTETQVNRAVRITVSYSLLSGLVGLLIGAVGVGMVYGADRSQIGHNAAEISKIRQSLEQVATDLNYLRGKFDGGGAKASVGCQPSPAADDQHSVARR